MRALEFLNEIAMNPNSLKKDAAKIDAKAGMEFEMYVPNAAEADDDYESEPDYDADETANDIDDIIQFFTGGDGYNDRRDLQTLREELEEAYSEWAMESQSSDWDADGMELLKTYIEENDWDEAEAIDQAMNDLGFTAEEKDAAKDAGESATGIMTSKELPDTPAYRAWVDAVSAAEAALEEKVQEEWNDQGRSYDSAREGWESDWEWPAQRDFLRDNGITHMSDVESNYSITWPYRSVPGGGDISIKDVAIDFMNAMGQSKIGCAESYHGTISIYNGSSWKNTGSKNKPMDCYTVEPDGSLDEPSDSSDGGVEFVSHPQPISDLLADLEKIKAWAKKTGCYTNESTGLHINVSVPQGSSRDYVKLAILLGDNYVLDEFERAGNTFCKSALDQVKQKAMTSDADAKVVLDKMRTGLDSIASQAIHTGNTNKYISINNKGNYIEFRSPGDDWLGDKFDKIENTLLRTVVALDAASDPKKYRKEYLKKFYKILTPMGKNDPLKYFAQYAAGELPKQALKSFIKQIQLERNIKKGGVAGKKYWYKVTIPGPNGSEIEVVAGSPEEAKATAVAEWGIGPAYDRQHLVVVPLRPYEEFSAPPGSTRTRSGYLTPNRDWEPETTPGMVPWQIVNRTSGARLGEPFWGPADVQSAHTKAMQIISNWNYTLEQRSELTIQQLEPDDPRLGSHIFNTTTPDRQRERWNRWDITYRDGYIEHVTARNQQEAMASAESTGHGEVVSTLADPSGTRQSTEDQLSAAYDQAFPPSEAPNTEGPGDYALVDTGNAVHDYIRVFPRMANRQAAHDAAVQWLNNNGDQFDPAQRRYFQLQRIPR